MGNIYKLLEAGAELTRNWMEERDRFGEFAKPYWMEWGGEGLVAHMMNKYVHNNDKSIVEYLYNLDDRNKELVLKYLDWR